MGPFDHIDELVLSGFDSLSHTRFILKVYSYHHSRLLSALLYYFFLSMTGNPKLQYMLY